jgi:hypothetical protein
MSSLKSTGSFRSDIREHIGFAERRPLGHIHSGHTGAVFLQVEGDHREVNVMLMEPDDVSESAETPGESTGS